MNSNGKQTHDSANYPYVKIVLKLLALKGGTGMLVQTIADRLNISSIEVKRTLEYLETNGFVEGIQGGQGTKYFLDERGRKYCIKKGYLAE